MSIVLVRPDDGPVQGSKHVVLAINTTPHIISCVSTVLSCTILLYLTHRGCHNLRFCYWGFANRSQGISLEHNYLLAFQEVREGLITTCCILFCVNTYCYSAIYSFYQNTFM